MINRYRFNPQTHYEPSEITDESVIIIYETGNFGLDNLVREGVYKLGGRAYNFRDILKRYVYETEDGRHQGWYPNKKLLRKNVHRRVYEILEAKKS